MFVRAVTTTVATLALATAAQAGILFDNFGSGDEYDYGIGWTLGGGDEIQLGPGFVMAAGGDHYLNSITASIRYVLGENAVTLSVYDSIGGVPGNLLETASATNLPDHDGSIVPPTVFAFSGSTILEEGQTYWVIASVPTGAWLAWNWNSVGDFGLHAQKFGEGDWMMFPNFERGVMRVEGTLVPAPGALMLLGLGLIGARRRRA